MPTVEPQPGRTAFNLDDAEGVARARGAATLRTEEPSSESMRVTPDSE